MRLSSWWAIFSLTNCRTGSGKYFGAIKKPSEKIPRVTAQEPPRKEDKKIVEYSPKAPLPAMAITYLAPSIRSERRAGVAAGG